MFLTVFPFKFSPSASLYTTAAAPPLYANERDVGGSQRYASLPTDIPLKAYLKPWLQLQEQRTTYATEAAAEASDSPTAQRTHTRSRRLTRPGEVSSLSGDKRGLTINILLPLSVGSGWRSTQHLRLLLQSGGGGGGGGGEERRGEAFTVVSVGLCQKQKRDAGGPGQLRFP